MFMESKGKTRLIRISVWVAVLSLLFAVLSSLATALAASAHAALTSVTPVDGTTVAEAPAEVVLTFNEAISTSFAAVTVTDGQGAPVTRGRPAVAGPTVTQALEPVGSGTYTVSFRVVSEDGHAVSSRTTFRVRLAAGDTTPASGTVATPTSSASDTAPAGHVVTVHHPGLGTGCRGARHSPSLGPRRGRRHRGCGRRRGPGPRLVSARIGGPDGRFQPTAQLVLTSPSVAPLAQLAEQLTLNQRVRGSSP